MAEMVERGRSNKAFGENASNAILKEKDVSEILKLSAEGYTNVEIAEQFGIVPQNVSSIVLGERWVHIPGPRKKRRVSNRFKGVTKHGCDRWQARLCPGGDEIIYLGLFPTEIAAAQAYNNYIITNGLNKPLNIIPTNELSGLSVWSPPPANFFNPIGAYTPNKFICEPIEDR
jgi:hypothetical protein